MRDLFFLHGLEPFCVASRPVRGAVLHSGTRCEYIPVRSSPLVPRVRVPEWSTAPLTSPRCSTIGEIHTQAQWRKVGNLQGTEARCGVDHSKTVSRGTRALERTGMYSPRVLEWSTPQRAGRSAITAGIKTFLIAMLTLLSALTTADAPKVTVATTYIDVHTGPGKGYPIFHIIEKDEAITLEKRRTDWIKITTRRGKTGWIHVDSLANTHDQTGQAPDIRAPTREDYGERRWELGFAGGDFDGADALGIHLGYRFTEHLTTDLRIGQNTGQFSDSQILSIGLMHQPFPDWWVSPYFRLGTGQIRIQPSATLVEAEDREDNLFQTSLGAYVYLTRRFFLRLEMTQHQILTSRDTNEEVNEWQLGFNVYF